MTDETLKPCPFCGGGVVEKKDKCGVSWAECVNCEAEWGHCPAHIESRYSDWNTRNEPEAREPVAWRVKRPMHKHWSLQAKMSPTMREEAIKEGYEIQDLYLAPPDTKAVELLRKLVADIRKYDDADGSQVLPYDRIAECESYLKELSHE